MATSDSSIHEVDHRIDYAFWVIFMPVVLSTALMNMAWIITGPSIWESGDRRALITFGAVILLTYFVCLLGAMISLAAEVPRSMLYYHQLRRRTYAGVYISMAVMLIFLLLTD